MTLYANTELKGIVRGFREDYKKLADMSRTEHMKTLPQGAPIPEAGKIYDPIRQQAVEEIAAKSREKADSIIDEHLQIVHDRMTKAPDPDVSSALLLMAARDNVTENELTHFCEAHGENYQAYRALQDVAHKHGYHIPDHKLDTQERLLSDLKSNVDGALTAEAAAKMGDGYYSLVEAEVDGVISDF